ncbi:hypothetical protein ACWEF9_27765 [Streptomyces sp. NPDC004980]
MTPSGTGATNCGPTGRGLRAAIAHTTLAAQAIWKRDRIDAERYRALVGPFRDVGIGVPDRE